MPGWERAARRFLGPWERRQDVAAAIACGSFVTGRPTPRSDVDLVIVLAEGTTWRERGNREVDGFRIEYFANAPEQTRAYWRDDHAAYRRVTATMFVTGRILFDELGLAKKLVREAARWHAKPLPKLSRAEREARQYAMWDGVDNTLDAAERGAADLPFQYHHAVHQVYDTYARFLRQPVLPPGRVHGTLGPRGHPERYRLEPFPDAAFVRLLSAALRETEPARMPRRLERLAAHAQHAMGGFEIDGWKLRTPGVSDGPKRRKNRRR